MHSTAVQKRNAKKPLREGCPEKCCHLATKN